MKASSFLLLILSILILSGCISSDTVSIHEYEWKISTIQRREDGVIIACSPEQNALYENASAIELNCAAKNGSFTLTDLTNRNTYDGTYKSIETNHGATIYEITLRAKHGNAVAAITSYQDGSKIPTLIISTEEYVLNFFAEQ